MISKIYIIVVVVGLFVTCYGQDETLAAENDPPVPPLPVVNATNDASKNFTKPDGFHGGPPHNHTDMGPPKNSSIVNRPPLPPLPPQGNGSLPILGSQIPPQGNGQQDSGKKASKPPKSSKAPKSKASKNPKSKRTTKPSKPEKEARKDAAAKPSA